VKRGKIKAARGKSIAGAALLRSPVVLRDGHPSTSSPSRTVNVDRGHRIALRIRASPNVWMPQVGQK
jgi:hypothetical protein